MILSAESQKAIDTYLMALRKQLRPLRPEDANGDDTLKTVGLL